MYLQSIPAYVYKIRHTSTGKFYFGFRSHNIKCNRTPEQDFLIYYFSSSALVKSMIKKHGIDQFECEIIYKNTDIDAAYWYEQKLIQDCFSDPLLMNKQYIDPLSNRKKFLSHGLIHSTESVTRAKETRLKNSKPRFNQTEESIKKQLETKQRNGFKSMSNPDTIAKWKESRKQNNKKKELLKWQRKIKQQN